MRALVLHAHPDDELLWAGALILSYPGWQWTVASLTGGLRAEAYQTLPAAFAKRGVTVETVNFGFADAPGFSAKAWAKAVASLPLFGITFTHGPDGEYGHPHHVAVSRLATGNVWHFAESGISIAAMPDKVRVFVEVYGESVLDELKADKPALIGRLFTQESFERAT